MKGFASIRFLLLIIWIAALVAPPSLPQSSTATVSGTVRDQTGAIIPKAPVALTNQATNVTSKTTTNETGFYLFAGQVPGPYLLTVEAPGMQRFEGALTVDVAQSAVVNVAMKVGQTATQVAVQDVTPNRQRYSRRRPRADAHRAVADQRPQRDDLVADGARHGRRRPWLRDTGCFV